MTAQFRGTFRSLETRNFRLYLTGHFVSQAGNWSRMVAQSLLVLSLTENGVAVGVLAACQFGPLLVLGAWAGSVVDRIDKLLLLRAVQVVTSLVSFSLAAFTFAGDPPLGALYALALAGGIGNAFENPARRSLVAELVPVTQVHNAVSLNTAATNLSQIIGPAFAGVLITTAGYAWCFVFDGCSYLFMTFMLSRLAVSEVSSPPRPGRAPGQVRAGLRYVLGVPELRTVLLMLLIVCSLAYNNFQVIFPLFVTRSLDGSEFHYTLLFSMLSIGSLAAVLVVAGQVTVSVRQVIVTALIFGSSLMAMAAVPSIGLALATAVVVGAAAFSYLASSNSLLQVKTDPAMRGRVLALQAIVVVGGAPLGGPAVGAVAQVFGPRTALVLGAASCWLAAGLGTRVRRAWNGAASSQS